MEDILIYIIATLIILLFAVVKIKKDGLKKYAIEMIVFAEKNYKDNKIKFESVVNALINKLPFPLNLIPTTLVEDFVQKIFDDIKIALDYQKEEN